MFKSSMIRLARINEDGGLRFEEFNKGPVPAYAILSHVWENDEVTYHDILAGAGQNKTGFYKVEFCRLKTRRMGIKYFWMDSICINRSSSAELTEAANSMFTWFKNANMCFVYLSDVVSADRWREPVDWLYYSRWFKRGWTLQELIAPRIMIFYTREGHCFGTKGSLAPIIHEITKIPINAIKYWDSRGFFLYREKERLSWAHGRKTTIEEDEAYCMLGLLGVSMPLVYGEGKENALRRLHEALEKRAKRRASVPKIPMPDQVDNLGWYKIAELRKRIALDWSA